MTLNSYMHWLIVAAYVGTAAIITAVALRGNGRKSWLWLAFGMFTLGVIKQQNLLGWLTNLGRNSGWRNGWYQNRGGVQLLITAGLLAFSLLLYLAAKQFFLTGRSSERLALVGFCLLCSFVAVRAVSLHAVDAFLYTPHVGIYPNWLVELGGIGLVAVPSIRNLRNSGVPYE